MQIAGTRKTVDKIRLTPPRPLPSLVKIRSQDLFSIHKSDLPDGNERERAQVHRDASGPADLEHASNNFPGNPRRVA